MSCKDAIKDFETRLTRLEDLLDNRHVEDVTPMVAASSAEPMMDNSGASEERVRIDRNRVAEAIAEAAERDQSMGWFKARRIQKVMHSDRPRFRRARERAIDHAIDQMLQAGVVTPTEEGVEAAVDWDSILRFLEGMLPIILQLIQIVGG